MGTAPGSVKLVKAGFVVLDGATGAISKVLAFQYNPETLVRRVVAAGGGTGSTGVGAVGGLTGAAGLAGVGNLGGVPVGPTIVASPPEFVSFTLLLDAADKLNAGDAVTQQDGLLPAISSLELLLYSPSSLLVWVSGSHRIVPVRITEMVITEQNFDPLLNPIRAQVQVQLQVLKDADLPAGSKGRAIWDAHLATLEQLANLLAAGSLSALGITAL